MRSQPWSVGILMVAMGGIGSAGIGGHHPTAIGYALAAFLVVGGGLLILRLTLAFWVAIAAALALTVSGALAWGGHPGWAMPVPAMLSIVIGLYLILRTVMARPALGKKPRRPLSDEPSPPAPQSPVGEAP
ncbi:MAG TPA: hypothetical protein VII38_10975 [Polyangia bacterium]|jgi:hypothetical protein